MKNAPYSEKEIEILTEGGKRLAGILDFLGNKCVEGVSAKMIDEMAEKMVLESGDIPVFKNYRPRGAEYAFPATICVSVNDVVAHGIPTEKIIFKNGDVVSLDLGLRHDGLVVDSALSVIVGEKSENGSGSENKSENKSESGKSAAFSAEFARETLLLEVTKKALEIGISKCIVGNRVNDIGIAIEKYVNTTPFKVVDILCGHAVGREVHSAPLIPHADFGPGGEKIKEGMVLAIEPHISMGNGQISLSKIDSWSYIADDGHKSAQFEHTILVTTTEPFIFTKK